MNLQQSLDLYAGGQGSGCHGDTCGRPAGSQSKSEKAKASYANTSSWKNVMLTDQNQNELAKVLKAEPTSHLSPFDVIDMKRSLGIEVKTLVNAKNDKLTQHPHSWRRKVVEAKKLKLQNIVTVAFDDRPGKGSQMYYRLGVGSFDLHTMTKVNDLKHLTRELDRVRVTERFGKSYGKLSIKKRKS